MEDARSYFVQTLSDCVAEDWILVSGAAGDNEPNEKNPFDGVTLMAEKKTGQVVFLSTRKSPDLDRWSVMPSLERFHESLLVLDLDKSRYLKSIDESVVGLTNLKQLMLTRCSSLTRLPDSIGNLNNLTEVSGWIERWAT